jgi:hypothetical protein
LGGWVLKEPILKGIAPGAIPRTGIRQSPAEGSQRDSVFPCHNDVEESTVSTNITITTTAATTITCTSTTTTTTAAVPATPAAVAAVAVAAAAAAVTIGVTGVTGAADTATITSCVLPLHFHPKNFQSLARTSAHCH